MYQKNINLTLVSAVLVLLGFYIYQTISIASGNVSLMALKKEFFEIKEGAAPRVQNEFNLVFEKENSGMAEIEKFDYIILGPSEFALVKEDEGAQQ